MKLPKLPKLPSTSAGALVTSLIVGVAAVIVIGAGATDNKNEIRTVSPTALTAAEQAAKDATTVTDPASDQPSDTPGTSTGSTSTGNGTTQPAGTTTETPAVETPVKPFVVDTQKETQDDGETVIVTCHYTWNDGHVTSKIAVTYPTPKSDGYNNVVVYPTCPDAL